MIEAFWQDIRFGSRMLFRKPVFTAVALLTLAIGIGANTAVFQCGECCTLRSLPYRDPDCIVKLWNTFPPKGIERELPFSEVEFLEFRNHNQSFAHVSAFFTVHTKPH